MKELKKKLVRKQVISLLLIAVVIAVSAITIVFSNNRQTIFSRASDHDLGGDCPWPNTCGPPDGCNSWEKCINGVCHDTTNGGKNSPSDDSCGGTGQPDPAAPECFSPDKCVGGRWCGDDGKFKDKLNGRCSGGITPNPVGECVWTCGNGYGCAKQSDVDHFKNVYGQYALKEWLIEACDIAVQPTAAPTVRPPTVSSPTPRPPTNLTPTPVCEWSQSCDFFPGVNGSNKYYSRDDKVNFFANRDCTPPAISYRDVEFYCRSGSGAITATPTSTNCYNLCCSYKCSDWGEPGSSGVFYQKEINSSRGSNCNVLDNITCPDDLIEGQSKYEGTYINNTCEGYRLNAEQKRNYCAQDSTPILTPIPTSPSACIRSGEECTNDPNNCCTNTNCVDFSSRDTARFYCVERLEQKTKLFGGITVKCLSCGKYLELNGFDFLYQIFCIVNKAVVINDSVCFVE